MRMQKLYICAFSASSSHGTKNLLRVAPTGCNAGEGFDRLARAKGDVGTCTGCFLGHPPACERFIPALTTQAGRELFEQKYKVTSRPAENSPLPSHTRTITTGISLANISSSTISDAMARVRRDAALLLGDTKPTRVGEPFFESIMA
jgi:hypothetical protein